MIMRGCSSIASNKKILLVCSDILRERAKIPLSISAENFCSKGFIEHKLILLNHVAQYVHINSKSVIKSHKDLNISDYSESNLSKTAPINTNVPPTVLPQNKVLVQYDQLISASSVDNQSTKSNNIIINNNNNNIDDVLKRMEDIEVRTSKLFKSNDLNMNLALNNDTKNKTISSPPSFKKTITGKEVIIDSAVFTKSTPTKAVDAHVAATVDVETIIDNKLKELSASLLEKQKLLFIDYTNNINSKLLLLENRIKFLESKK